MSYERGSVNDWTKVRRIDGVIYYQLYQQDGSMQDMTCSDTLHNRQCISWMQMHDRYTGADPS